ncbi:sigma-54-dependent Fis family transcriptional regulator [Paracoccus sp. J39]|uniref:sigma-54-dependent Fis family transcriptional regulator n=1 Tax=Paracoccus sp. J39 TaxID=935848 RepID=UPI00048D3FD2|nr:helix-turn-helix domain-containing protein [Paracoccus sp. J39]
MPESIQKEDWERFRALGSVPPSIREVVLRSWVRSRGRKEIETLKRAPSVAQDELRAIRNRNQRLRSAAQTAIRRAGYMLNDAGMMLLLCDRGGVVMEAEGDARILSRGQENHLHPGGHWDEDAIGTNAIGTALHLAKPVTISGVEHFCEAIQRWSCAAAPIRDPFNGALLGAIDISGPSGQSFGQVAAFSVTLAMQIEEAIRNAGLQEHRRLIERLLAERRGQRGDEIMVLDRFGQPVWSSADFRSAAGRAWGDEAGAALPLPPDAHQGDPGNLAARLRQVLPHADVDVLVERGDMLGVMVTLQRPGARGRPAPDPAVSLAQIAQSGAAMAPICAAARKYLESGVPLLIEGPVGAGKETLARALHLAGPLSGQPLEFLDCSLLDPETLRGDLIDARLARLAEAGGTLCLDEPAQTPRQAQPLLVQALARLARAAPVPPQILSLSSVGLAERMAQGDLRGDLYFRLAAATLRLPGLAERRDDLPGLIRRFAQAYPQRRRGKALRFTPAAMRQLQAHDWPGNLRELRNLMESLGATSLSGLVDRSDLPAHLARPAGPRREETLRDRERAEIAAAVAEAGGNMTEVARRLGIARSTLYLKLDQYGIPRPRRD